MAHRLNLVYILIKSFEMVVEIYSACEGFDSQQTFR